MAEMPDANNKLSDRDGQGGKNGAPYCQHRKFKKNRKKKQESTKASFKGPLPGYKTYIYDISRNKGSDEFSATTRKLSEYISRTVVNAGEFMDVMNPDDLGFERIEEPEDPENGATAIDIEKWKTKYKHWNYLTSKRNEAKNLRTRLL